MNTVVLCGACGQAMRVATANLGKVLRCPACDAPVPTRGAELAEAVQIEQPPARHRPRRRGPSSDACRGHAKELMREAHWEIERQGEDYGMPWYIWLLAALPWGIPVLTLGGCIWVMVAAGLSAGAFSFARMTRVPIIYRALGLIALDGVAYSGILVLLIAVLSLSSIGSYSWVPWRLRNASVANVVPAGQPSGQPAPVQPDPPKPKQHKEPPSASRIPDLLAYWAFDSKHDADRAKDQSGHGNDAMVHGAANTDGVRGKALQFNGRDAYCDLGGGPDLDFAAGAPFTIAGWVRTRAAAGTVVSLRNSGDDGADIDVTIEGGRIKGLVRQNGGMLPTGVTSRLAVHDDSWHHFAVTRTADGTVELFLDGDSQGNASGRESAGAITTDLRALGSERYWVKQGRKGVDGAAAYLNGGIDEVCVFGRMLDGNEIRTLAGQ